MEILVVIVAFWLLLVGAYGGINMLISRGKANRRTLHSLRSETQVRQPARRLAASSPRSTSSAPRSSTCVPKLLPSQRPLPATNVLARAVTRPASTASSRSCCDATSMKRAASATRWASSSSSPKQSARNHSPALYLFRCSTWSLGQNSRAFAEPEQRTRAVRPDSQPLSLQALLQFFVDRVAVFRKVVDLAEQTVVQRQRAGAVGLDHGYGG